MNSTINRDGWTATARVLGAVVAAWAVVAAVGMGATSDGSAWMGGDMVPFVLGLVLALYGVWAMPSRPRSGAIACATAAVLTTVPIWFLVIPMLGAAVAAYFVVFAVRERRMLPTDPA